jgi:hypothetical protein
MVSILKADPISPFYALHKENAELIALTNFCFKHALTRRIAGITPSFSLSTLYLRPIYGIDTP